MQHPWSSTVRLAIDLEAMGTGGKSGIFQVINLSYEPPLIPHHCFCLNLMMSPWSSPLYSSESFWPLLIIGNILRVCRLVRVHGLSKTLHWPQNIHLLRSLDRYLSTFQLLCLSLLFCLYICIYMSLLLLWQDLFTSGIIKSATDFQVYKEVAGLSGLDFAFADNTAVYHTKVTLFIFFSCSSCFDSWFIFYCFAVAEW